MGCAVYLAVEAYNKFFHRAIGCTPFELLQDSTAHDTRTGGELPDRHMRVVAVQQTNTHSRTIARDSKTAVAQNAHLRLW